ncbi:allograft inflammatory factor 1 [Salpingoeca rosetta]|uniref:Allograft inflammatory factor 1 n=1 Tax=Salpingoeca rosetta (strain ATCC 50818 / BSB-021) TaxID=946362 RepID=F2TX26_SALR5|nr:allograft inflammatory factor 1 [Salpingoeca rosetta]EGD75935.1 allograft inflammatory factor 1 [Salpingoeca rosetta]|eukprot:XP_004998111.1 allograft inflammatory factor 1 [Salpingoeca rosetta]
MQGGKAFGQLKDKQSAELDRLNEQIISDGKYEQTDDLAEKLEKFKHKFMEFDEDHSGDIDMMELKRMMEKLGQPKTHLELKKMIAEVDTNDSGTINYHEFVQMMLGPKKSILRIILMYEEMAKPKDDAPKGPPPKRSLADLP